MSAPLKIDLHVHTCYSYDAVTSLKEVIACCKKRGLDGVAITDHDTIEGALKLAKTREIIAIPGIEVETLHGHLLALNVTTPIPSNLSASETVEMVHEAGGIAVACHPTSFYKMGWKPQILGSSNLDAVEVINSSTFPFSLSTDKNRKLAARFNLPQTAGSDSHIPETIGMAYTLIEAGSKIEEIVQAIKKGATLPQGKAISLKARFKKAFLGLKDDVNTIKSEPSLLQNSCATWDTEKRFIKARTEAHTRTLIVGLECCGVGTHGEEESFSAFSILSLAKRLSDHI